MTFTVGQKVYHRLWGLWGMVVALSHPESDIGSVTVRFPNHWEIPDQQAAYWCRENGSLCFYSGALEEEQCDGVDIRHLTTSCKLRSDL